MRKIEVKVEKTTKQKIATAIVILIVVLMILNINSDNSNIETIKYMVLVIFIIIIYFVFYTTLFLTDILSKCFFNEAGITNRSCSV